MEDTKQKIIDAAIAVFNDDQSAPLEKVADRASITRRTLHRYFKDRGELVAACRKDICKRCGDAIATALQRTESPLAQLEQLLYAGIDCGVKYAFFHKLHNSRDHAHRTDDDCMKYDAMREHVLQVITQLQDKAIVTKHLTAEWIYALFTGVVNTAVKADMAGIVAKQSQKQFAWLSFSRAVGA